MKEKCLFLGGTLVVSSLVMAVIGLVMRYTVFRTPPEDIAVILPIKVMKAFLFE